MHLLPRRLAVRNLVTSGALQHRAAHGELRFGNQNIGGAFVEIDPHAVAGLQQSQAAARGGLGRADEALLVGTTIEVLPIVRIDETTISGGRPGPIAWRLQAAYRRAVERWLDEPATSSPA